VRLLTDYEQLIDRVARALPELSNAKGRIAQYIADNPTQVAFMSAADLARKVKTSESVVVRLAVDLGYRGYPDLRSVLEGYVQDRLTTVELLERSACRSGSELAEATEAAIGVVRQTATLNTEHSLRSAVDLILKANRVCVLCVRAAKATGFHLGTRLNQALGNVQVLSDPGEWWLDLRTYTPADVAIAISMARYRRETPEAAAFLHERGVPVVAITDRPTAPIVRSATMVLLAANQSTWFGRSALGALFLAEVLLTLVGSIGKERCASGLSEFEKIMCSQNLIIGKHD